MTVRRFVQQRDGALIEVSPDCVAEPHNHDAVLWNDRDYQDVGDPRFSSRTQHREYMKRHGLTTIDDYPQHCASAEREREKFYRGEDSSRRADVERAIATVNR